ncbi:MAG: hypothetical protein JEZ05_09420 [Tenericutes bacterium]|nr:hypothetical protein [Mycoplasmatota bacterium]
MKYLEVVFDVLYLVIVIYLGFKLIKTNNVQKRTFGIMALILGFGDMFHLIPRIIGHLTTGLDDYTLYLGLGSAITSATMTVFYFLLYRDFERSFNRKNIVDRVVIYSMLILKFAVTFFPQNNWFTGDASYGFTVIRNAPFIIMGVYLVTIMLLSAYRENNLLYKKISYGVMLSFLFYMPVIFFVDFVPALGALMMPKTIAYVFVIYSVYRLNQKNMVDVAE